MGRCKVGSTLGRGEMTLGFLMDTRDNAVSGLAGALSGVPVVATARESVVALPSYHEYLRRLPLDAVNAGTRSVCAETAECGAVARNSLREDHVSPHDPEALVLRVIRLPESQEFRTTVGNVGRRIDVFEKDLDVSGGLLGECQPGSR